MISSQQRMLALVLIATPILCFILLLFVYTVDIPWMDDIDAFLGFIIGYLDAPTVREKLHWLLSPNNEHRILTGKLITLVMYKLTGTVNFRWLIFAGFAYLLGLLAIFYKVFRSTNLSLLVFAPVPFLLLQPQYYLTTTWAITSLQHQVAVAMVVVTIYLLAGGGRNRFMGGLGLQVLTSFSMSNGLFGWIAGAVVLALQRRWLPLAIWLIVSAVAILLYFYDVQNAQGNDSSIAFFLKYPYLIFLGFFTFTGGLFDFFPEAPIVWRSILPTLMGMGLIAGMLWLLWRMNEPILRGRVNARALPDRETAALLTRRYFFTGCYTFLLVNAVIVAFLRPRFGYTVMLISNYMIYPALLVALLYLNALSEQYKHLRNVDRWARFGAALGLVVWGFWYVMRWPKIAFRKQQLVTLAFNQKHNETGLGPSLGSPFVNLVKRIMDESIRRRIYKYPDAYYTPYESSLNSKACKQLIDPSLDMHITGGGYSYQAETGFNTLQQLTHQSAIVVQSAQRTYLFPSALPFSKASFYLNRPVRTVQAEIIIPMIASGQYRIGILTPAGNLKKSIRFSRQMIAIP